MNVTLLIHRFTNNDVTVTLQWVQEAGAVYHVSVLPEISHILFTNAVNHNVNTITINLTIPYNIQYNVFIISSLCGVTTTKVLNYGKLIYMHMGDYSAR